jgi:DNA-binding LacI/PurR family transcriptional regulator
MCYSHYTVKGHTRVTMKDVAQEAGVCASTVSLALRKHASIPAATREKIEAIAARLNYRPDPMLSALVAYRRAAKPASFGGTLAWIYNRPTRDEGKIPSTADFFAGAQERAQQVGYLIEKFWLRETGIKNRLTSILNARNIRGVIIPPLPKPRSHLRLDWKHFSVVTFGYSLTYPRFNTVYPHHFRAMSQLMRKLRSLGYRRIGLALPLSHDERVEHHWAGAFYFEQQRLPPKERIPPLWTKDFQDFTESKFIPWFQQHKPEAIVSFYWAEIPNWLKQLKLKIPQDVGFASPYVPPIEHSITGVQGNNKLMGAAAVDLLVEMLHRGDHGVPESPRHLLIEGTWFDGKTLRRVNV